MRKRDIKIGKYYYCVDSVESLFCSSFPNKSLITKFKMTKDIMINKPRRIFPTYILAKLKAVKNLKKFSSKQMKRIFNG